MAKDFIYFAGSLPMLFFGEKSPLSVAAFDEDAARLMDGESCALLKKVTLFAEDTDGLPAAAKKFYDWETALRNSTLEVRKKFRADAGDFKRGNPDFYSNIMPAVTQAANTNDLLEAEKILDRLRWEVLDDLSAGHYFDLDFLAVYRIKLQILAKYANRTVEKGNQALEDILTDLLEANNSN